jgi:hypothetical protein
VTKFTPVQNETKLRALCIFNLDIFQ